MGGDDPYAPLVKVLRETVLSSKGELDPAVRRAAAGQGALPDALEAYVGKVHRHAYQITDEDVAALKQAGYSEDQIFELTVCAAFGAAEYRLERGLAALRGAK